MEWKVQEGDRKNPDPKCQGSFKYRKNGRTIAVNHSLQFGCKFYEFSSSLPDVYFLPHSHHNNDSHVCVYGAKTC